MARVILLQPRQRLMDRARSWVDDPELFAANKERAVRDLLEVLPAAEPGLRHRIMMLLSVFAKEQSAEPLYGIVKDPSQEPRTRHYAAVQLAAVLPFLDDPGPFLEKLGKDVREPEPHLRRCAVTALGWRGNAKAFDLLAPRLYDEDAGVRLAAVNSLCSCGDARVLPLLLERLEPAPLEEKRAILFNLWRLRHAPAELARIYGQYLHHPSPELRLASLAMLSFSGEESGDCQALAACLKDSDPRVRKLALERFMEMDLHVLARAREEIRLLLDDGNMDIKRTALKALKSLESGCPG